VIGTVRKSFSWHDNREVAADLHLISLLRDCQHFGPLLAKQRRPIRAIVSKRVSWHSIVSFDSYHGRGYCRDRETWIGRRKIQSMTKEARAGMFSGTKSEHHF
jgi:hypothetical protein